MRYHPDIPAKPTQIAEISTSTAPTPTNPTDVDETGLSAENAIGIPDPVAASYSLKREDKTARDYAEQTTAENTNKAHNAD